ncbi:hypothetical protein [Roseofilum capinflatum]|uniref:Uncharacterized protein n=1 Tax=Roseofilum capinflatum BLCC-M114 TaxID=3022440 RepID=A0ABT7B240_9CYAN|nr:hypothetical protein [Roseofilum capinflatum]MDJ1173233.1 hypothetical protein [Roseofilum capinflatum BLCC-M114]
MKGYVQGRTIILLETLPGAIKDGDEVEITITPLRQEDYPFPTFELGVKDQYISRENIYEQTQDIF